MVDNLVFRVLNLRWDAFLGRSEPTNRPTKPGRRRQQRVSKEGRDGILAAKKNSTYEIRHRSFPSLPRSPRSSLQTHRPTDSPAREREVRRARESRFFPEWQYTVCIYSFWKRLINVLSSLLWTFIKLLSRCNLFFSALHWTTILGTTKEGGDKRISHSGGIERIKNKRKRRISVVN